MKRGLRGISGNYYCGLHEFSDMAFMMHYLRPGDLFVDVGANAGSYTVLAAAECGANVMAFEPVPETFYWLKKNIQLNGIEQLVDARQVAIAAEKGQAFFTTNLDAQNHFSDRANTDSMQVEVKTLDDVLDGLSPNCIKIDVEGFEAGVFIGGQATMRSDCLKVVVLETRPETQIKVDGEWITIHQWMLHLGFEAGSYNPKNRTLSRLKGIEEANTIYFKNRNELQERLKQATPKTIWNKRI